METTQTSSTEIPQNTICKQSTDRKPLFMKGFRGGYNNCLRFLHHSVKPIVGVVKYDFSDWQLFPTTIAQAKELALKWSDSLEKKTNFAGKSVVIFFHLEIKTIRVEVKTRQGYVFETPETAVGFSAQEVENKVKEITENDKKTYKKHQYNNNDVTPYNYAYVPSYMANQMMNPSQYSGPKKFRKPFKNQQKPVDKQ